MTGTMGRPPKHTARLALAVDPEVIHRVDAWCAQRAVPPTRSEALRYFILLGMKADAEQREKPKRRPRR